MRIPHVQQSEKPRDLVLLLGFLLLVDLAIVTINVASIILIGGVHQPFYLGQEANLPSWWSSMKLLLAGLCFVAVSLRTWRVTAAARGLAVLGLILVAMSADELGSFHEWIGETVDGATRSTSIFPHTGIWFVVVGLPFIVVMTLLLRNLRPALGAVPGTRRRLVLGFTVLLVGALAIEAASNFAFSAEQGASSATRLTFLFTVVVEEAFEMVGGSLLFWTAAVFMFNHPSLPGLASLATPISPIQGREVEIPC